jgi:sec-independent protein translocase protein TatA
LKIAGFIGGSVPTRSVDFNRPRADLPFMFGLGVPELLVILLIVVVIFGARRLPEIGAGLGEGIKNFRSAMKAPPEIDVTPKNDDSKKPQP